MRTRLLAIFLLSSVALADTFTNPETGLTIQVPDGWQRDTSQEGGSEIFSAVLPAGPQKQIRFSVAAAPANGFDADQWLASEKARMKKIVQEVDSDFTPNKNERVAGIPAAGFVVAGTVKTQAGTTYHLHFKVVGVVYQDTFFRIEEVDYNGVEKDSSAMAKAKAMWKAVSFGDVKAAPTDLTPPADLKPTEVKDEKGNWTMTLPAGWSVDTEPPVDADTQVRLVAVRKTPDKKTVCVLHILRLGPYPASFFPGETPTSWLGNFISKGGYLIPLYGKGADQILRPNTNEGVSFGGGRKTGSFEVSSNTVAELQAIRHAQDLQARGEKVKVPNPPTTVVRGRIAFLAPYVYLLDCVWVNRTLSEDAGLKDEFNKAADSFKLISTKPKPSPISVGGQEIGDTKDDPALKKEREDKTTYSEQGRKRYVVEIRFVLPPGFKKVPEAVNGNVSLVVVAQDKNNASVVISVVNVSERRVGDEHKVLPDKKVSFTTWKSSWESKAINARVPSRPQRFRIGNLSGEGYRDLKGTVDRFPATFTGLVDDSHGWRTIIEIHTKGGGREVFDDGLKTFMRHFRVRDKS